MAHVPQVLLEEVPVITGLDLRNRGKVRDSYDLPGHSDKMLPFVTDRVSAFDFVLASLVPYKGAVLNALSHFWVAEVLADLGLTDITRRAFTTTRQGPLSEDERRYLYEWLRAVERRASNQLTREQREALAGGAGDSDDRRGGGAGLRGGAVVRGARAGPCCRCARHAIHASSGR